MIAPIFGFRLWSQDVAEAYLQSCSHSNGEIYVRPTQAMKLISGQLLRQLKTLHGLDDSGDSWHAAMAKHLKAYMEMMALTLDLACFIKVIDEHLSDIVGTYVEEYMAMCNTNFKKESRLTEHTFYPKSRGYDSFAFAGT